MIAVNLLSKIPGVLYPGCFHNILYHKLLKELKGIIELLRKLVFSP